MKITNEGTLHPLVTLTSLIAGGTGGGPDGQVPTANGSNGVAWGSNVAIITSNGSNALIGPFVNFASGSGIAFAAASNTLTISSTVTGSGGGGGPTGSKYVTTASDPTLTAEVVIPGLAGSADHLPTSANAADEEFDAALSGFTNLNTLSTMDANTYKSMAHFAKTSATGVQLNGGYKAYTPTNGDTWTVKIEDALLFRDFQCAGIFLGEATPGKMLSLSIEHEGADVHPVRATWTNATTQAANVNYLNPGSQIIRPPAYLRLTYNTSTSVDGAISFNGLSWHTLWSALDPAFTVGSVGICAWSNTNTVDVEVFADWLRKNWTPLT